MRLFDSSVRLMLAFGLLALGFGVSSSAHAQGLPNGSYTRSCNSINMVQNVLEATCQRADGSWASTALPNPGACAYGVENQNGSLACSQQPVQQSTTSQYSDGLTTIHNSCNGQNDFFVVATNNKVTTGLIVILTPGQSVQLGVTQGSSYNHACGSVPTDSSHYQYFTVHPTQ